MAAKKTDFYSIVKNVPIPHVRNSAGDSLLKAMKVGDMFKVPATEFKRATWVYRARVVQVKLAMRKIDEHTFGVWRIK